MSFKAMIDGEPSLKKPAMEPTSNLPLPNDLVLSCLARVSRLYYPILSLVSKSFRSLLASPELYKTRSLLGCTESCLYVCLRFPPNPSPCWFTLCRKLDKPLLAPIPILNSPPTEWSSLVAVDHYLYAICGDIKDAPCSNVPFLDCRTHTWLEAPTMRLAHKESRFDGRMYLAGSCENPDSLNCIEVFNTKTQIWKPVPPEKRKLKLRNMEGKILIRVSKKMSGALKPKEWAVEIGINRDLDYRGICTIDNITYVYRSNSGVFEWSNNKVGAVWRKLEGLEGLPNLACDTSVTLVDYDGKMVVLWDRFVPESGCKEKMIWCAVISLFKRGDEEIWGNVEWFDVVLTVPNSYKLMYAIAATF